MSTPVSLLKALAQVPDPRNPKGGRHPLPAILALAVLAMLSGAKSYTAIAQFGRDKGLALAWALGFRRGKTLAKFALSVVRRPGRRRLRGGPGPSGRRTLGRSKAGSGRGRHRR